MPLVRRKNTYLNLVNLVNLAAKSAFGGLLLTGLFALSLQAAALSPKSKGPWDLKGSCNYRWNNVWEEPLFSIWGHRETGAFAIDLFDAQNMLNLEYRDFRCAYFQLHRDGFVIVLSRYLQNNYVGVILEKDEETEGWQRTEIHCEMVPHTVAPHRPQQDSAKPVLEPPFPPCRNSLP